MASETPTATKVLRPSRSVDTSKPRMTATCTGTYARPTVVEILRTREEMVLSIVCIPCYDVDATVIICIGSPSVSNVEWFLYQITATPTGG